MRTNEDRDKLAAAEAQLIISGELRAASVNVQLGGVLPARSREAIKKIRQTRDHKSRVASFVDRDAQAQRDPTPQEVEPEWLGAILDHLASITGPAEPAAWGGSCLGGSGR